uniref:Uncharacterized protein n=1 Tax=Pyxicephalus adspersus TaxID=30357 RepID=A0AAV2ZYZ0_PYXAD|nr:TPA: hypothetical protein GDO54_013121 [Pyxicephalus adspersus]
MGKNKRHYLQLIVLKKPSYFLYILLFILLSNGIFLKIFYKAGVLIFLFSFILLGKGEKKLFFAFVFICCNFCLIYVIPFLADESFSGKFSQSTASFTTVKKGPRYSRH